MSENKKRQEIDEKFHNSLFYFISGFFFLPFLFFTIVTTVNLIKLPQMITDGMAILYIALLAGTYYVIDGKDGYPFFGKSRNSLKNQSTMTVGLIIFILCFVFFNKGLDTILSIVNIIK